MFKIQKVYIKEFIKMLLILNIGVSIVFSIITIVNKLDSFLPHNPSFLYLLTFMLLKIPKNISYLLPMTILLSSLFVFSQSINRREIDIIKTSGIKIKNFILPFIYIGIILTLFGFIISEIVTPISEKKSKLIKNRILNQENKVTITDSDLYIRGEDGSVIKASLYIQEKQIIQDINIFLLNENGLDKKIVAKTATWKDNIWKLQDVKIFDITNNKITEMPQMQYSGIENPKNLNKNVWQWEEMTIRELIEYKNKLVNTGFKNRNLIVTIYSRLTYPLINLFMMLLGISLVIGSEQKGLREFYKIKFFTQKNMNIGLLSASLGIVISIAYWLGYTFCLSLGYIGALPQEISPLIMPILFLTISTYLFYHIPE